MAIPKKTKITASVVIAAAVLAVIAFGAFRGRTRHATPAAALTASGPAYAPEGSQAPLRQLKTYTRRDCSLAPWLIADKLGYFRDEGVELVFTGEIQAAQWVPSILNGTNDVTSLHPNSAAVVINGGARIRGVARAGREPAPDLSPEFRHMWWFVNPEKYPDVRSFADLKDLPGQLKFTTGTVTSCSDFLANQILLRYGVPLDKIEWVTMPDVQATQALAQGLSDVGGVHPPFYKGMVDAGQRKVADTIEAGLPPESAGVTHYYFMEDFIRDNPETVKGFARAMIRSQRFINANPEQARIWTQEAIGVPVSANHYYAEELDVDGAQVIPWLEDLERQGAIPKGKLKPEDLLTVQFDDPNFSAQAWRRPAGPGGSIIQTASRL
ncbi:MAG: ABC transporter substrate-binding protein [Deltaproteobacteria bacterium]|jgi:ABC-type nitrate/sulfonate/bicarbonate transport system substrate-binding protein|nr:ABC transporter substrate-binding protein [Deltaproteobacteria bacterium]